RANRAAYSAYQAVENSSDLPCYRIFCKQPQVPDYCPVRRTIETLQPQQRQVCVAGHDYMILTKPLFDSNGKFTYVLENAVEITQLNQRQQKLTEAMEAAQAADRAKSYFLATMSHELRTPLNAVIGFSELLQSGPMPDQEQQNALRAINVAGATLLELINDILDLSKLEAGKMDIIPELLDPQEFLQTVSAIFTHTARTRKLSLTVTVPPAMPHLKFDRKRLRQVLVNLLGNAFKFTETGGVLLEAAFETVNDHFGTLILKVSDTGIGMSPETVRQLFDPFRQHHTRDYEGTGLGLAISQRLVARMGGSIEVTSEPEHGSTFRIVLPGVEYRRSQAVPASLPEPEKDSPVLSAKVLLVDDVVMNLKVLGAMLDKLHVPYLGCTSGPQALELAAREKPCMILTDLWMPDMNGDELVDKLKQLPATAGIPVIAVTADIQLTPKLNRNFAGILYKPVTMDKLRQALQFASDGVPFAENTRGRLREQETKDEPMTT
uniref:ATP-binding protein n=1 Tax=Victivallis vadensis TaxID=172901 RepID=UPI00266BBE55